MKPHRFIPFTLLIAALILLGHSFLPHAHETEETPTITNTLSYHIHISLFGIIEGVLSQDHGEGHLEHFQRTSQLEVNINPEFQFFQVVETLAQVIEPFQTEPSTAYQVFDSPPARNHTCYLPACQFRGPPLI